jgi:hypothetical protein
MAITYKRISNGQFEVLRDGVKLDGYGIVNGSLGVSGHGSNMYGILRPGKAVRWIGTLQACKKLLSQWLSTPKAEVK